MCFSMRVWCRPDIRAECTSAESLGREGRKASCCYIFFIERHEVREDVGTD